MIKKTLILGFLLCFVSAAVLTGQEKSEPTLDDILKEALSLFIHARLSQDEQRVMWESEVDKLTIPGRPVTIHLKNGQARLSVHFTPYRKKEGGLVLVAQSELWLLQQQTKSQPEGLRYYTSMKSIPLDFGETVLFFPLGKMDNLNNPEKLHIEMAVMISPYQIKGDAASVDAAPESSEESSVESVN